MYVNNTTMHVSVYLPIKCSIQIKNMGTNVMDLHNILQITITHIYYITAPNGILVRYYITAPNGILVRYYITAPNGILVRYGMSNGVLAQYIMTTTPQCTKCTGCVKFM
jgi:hypothetical protein